MMSQSMTERAPLLAQAVEAQLVYLTSLVTSIKTERIDEELFAELSTMESTLQQLIDKSNYSEQFAEAECRAMESEEPDPVSGPLSEMKRQYIAALRSVSADLLAYAGAVEKDPLDAEWDGSELSLIAEKAICDALFPNDATAPH